MDHEPPITPSMRYSVAVKREFRDEIPADWLQQLEACEGLSFESKPLFGRVMIEADEDGLKAARAALGEMVHIEPIIRHQTSEDEGAGESDPGEDNDSAASKPLAANPIDTPWERRR